MNSSERKGFIALLIIILLIAGFRLLTRDRSDSSAYEIYATDSTEILSGRNLEGKNAQIRDGQSIKDSLRLKDSMKYKGRQPIKDNPKSKDHPRTKDYQQIKGHPQTKNHQADGSLNSQKKPKRKSGTTTKKPDSYPSRNPLNEPLN